MTEVNEGAHLELSDGRRVPLERAALTLGRGVGNDVDLRDDQVSRRHARLKPLPQGWVLMDLGSANGTWVDGYQVTAPYLLHDGAQIVLGEQRLVYHAGQAAAPAQGKRQRQETVLGRSAFGLEGKRDTRSSADETPTGEHDAYQR